MGKQAVKQEHAGALAAVFADADSLATFQREDPETAAKALPRFAQYAFDHGLVAEPTLDALGRFVEQGSGQPGGGNPLPAGFTFSDLMDRIADDGSVSHVVETELRPLCRQLGLPDVQPSMISRLRGKFVPNTRGKRNLLRVLAFWIGLCRPDWRWGFNALMRIQNSEESAPESDPNDGVRIAFRIIGPGELLEAKALELLKVELAACAKDLRLYYLDPGQIVAASTTVFVDIPCPKGDRPDATRYTHALRDAFALVHQALVRWDLAESRQSNRVVVGIAIGPFASLDMSIQAMLKARLSDGDVIRMTSFVRTCVDLAEIKVVFQPEPREVSVYAGDTLTVWVADSLWSHAYYDYVSAMEGLLPADPDAVSAFKMSFYTGGIEDNPLLAAAYRQPENALLLIEIAKSCIAKGLFHEADRFLSIVLANRPLHVVARTLRLIIRLNVALALSDFRAAWFAFQDALNEGRFILDRCQVENEEVFCELGQVHFCIARRIYNVLLRGSDEELKGAVRECTGAAPATSDEARKLARGQVLLHLGEARACFDQGRTISPSGKGNRSLHWTFRIEALLRLLETDERAFDLGSWPDGIVLDRNDVFRQTSIRLFANAGLLTKISANPEDLTDEEQFVLFAWIIEAYDRYANSVRCPSYHATVQFAFAMLMFDFAPVLTVGVLKIIIKWMREAEAVAAGLAAKTRGIRSIVTCCSHIQPASLMLEQVRHTIRLLTNRYASALKRDDSVRITEGR